MRLYVKELAPIGPVLTGSLAGKRLLAKLIERTPDPFEPEPALLDFQGIDAVTSSYFRESVVAFRDYCTNRKNRLYPVLANLSDMVREEAEFYLRASDDLMLCCLVDDIGCISNVTFVGDIDPKARLAFEEIGVLGEADATTIWKKYRDKESVTVNAWNNRLANLSALRLIVEDIRGKTKFFRPVLKEA